MRYKHEVGCELFWILMIASNGGNPACPLMTDRVIAEGDLTSYLIAGATGSNLPGRDTAALGESRIPSRRGVPNQFITFCTSPLQSQSHTIFGDLPSIATGVRHVSDMSAPIPTKCSVRSRDGVT